MPSSGDILERLMAAATGMTPLAFGWHLVIVIVGIAMLRGWRPPARSAAVLLIAPALSVFIVSAAYASWFNAGSFLLLAVVLLLATRELVEPWQVRGSTWSLLLGSALVAFGLVYPHFVEGAWYRSLYAAPTGVVPCPTLAILAGGTLVTGASGSRAVPAVLAAWTAFYAAFGIGKLGVVLDVGLLAATFGLAVLAVRNLRVGRRPPVHATI